MIRRWLQRFVDKHAPIWDWPEIGSDDEPIAFTVAVQDALGREHDCGDDGCDQARERIRARIDREWYALHGAASPDYDEKLAALDMALWELEAPRDAGWAEA